MYVSRERGNFMSQTENKLMSIGEVAKLLGISRSYVSRIEKSALEKLLENI